VGTAVFFIVFPSAPVTSAGEHRKEVNKKGGEVLKSKLESFELKEIRLWLQGN
jgi:hypothetical protein